MTSINIERNNRRAGIERYERESRRSNHICLDGRGDTYHEILSLYSCGETELTRKEVIACILLHRIHGTRNHWLLN